MIVISDANSRYYPTNKPYRFKEKIEKLLVFNSAWDVGIVDLNVSLQAFHSAYIHSDVCRDAFVDGSSKPVLRRINTNENGNNLPIFNISYLPVRKTSITEIEFYITDEYGNLAR